MARGKKTTKHKVAIKDVLDHPVERLPAAISSLLKRPEQLNKEEALDIYSEAGHICLKAIEALRVVEDEATKRDVFTSLMKLLSKGFDQEPGIRAQGAQCFDDLHMREVLSSIFPHIFVNGELRGKDGKDFTALEVLLDVLDCACEATVSTREAVGEMCMLLFQDMLLRLHEFPFLVLRSVARCLIKLIISCPSNRDRLDWSFVGQVFKESTDVYLQVQLAEMIYRIGRHDGTLFDRLDLPNETTKMFKSLPNANTLMDLIVELVEDFHDRREPRLVVAFPVVEMTAGNQEVFSDGEETCKAYFAPDHLTIIQRAEAQPITFPYRTVRSIKIKECKVNIKLSEAPFIIEDMLTITGNPKTDQDCVSLRLTPAATAAFKGSSIREWIVAELKRKQQEEQEAKANAVFEAAQNAVKERKSSNLAALKETKKKSSEKRKRNQYEEEAPEEPAVVKADEEEHHDGGADADAYGEGADDAPGFVVDAGVMCADATAGEDHTLDSIVIGGASPTTENLTPGNSADRLSAKRKKQEEASTSKTPGQQRGGGATSTSKDGVTPATFGSSSMRLSIDKDISASLAPVEAAPLRNPVAEKKTSPVNNNRQPPPRGSTGAGNASTTAMSNAESKQLDELMGQLKQVISDKVERKRQDAVHVLNAQMKAIQKEVDYSRGVVADKLKTYENTLRTDIANFRDHHDQVRDSIVEYTDAMNTTLLDVKATSQAINDRRNLMESDLLNDLDRFRANEEKFLRDLKGTVQKRMRELETRMNAAESAAPAQAIAMGLQQQPTQDLAGVARRIGEHGAGGGSGGNVGMLSQGLLGGAGSAGGQPAATSSRSGAKALPTLQIPF